jgi:hypothetical protein
MCDEPLLNTYELRGILLGKAEFTPYSAPYQPNTVTLNTGKTPHKCPVCEGSGKLMTANKNKDAYANYAVETNCHACEGKGIVWG